MPIDLSTIKGTVAIIPAAGIGERVGANKPKQYLTIGGRTILGLTLDKFLNFDPVELVVIVVSPNDQYLANLRYIENAKIVVIDGGNERVESVNNALSYLFDNGLPDDTAVMIHDAARPCVTHEDMVRLIETFNQNQKACFLALPVADTLQQLDDEQRVLGPLDRRNIVRALTPQMARFADFKHAVESAVINKLPITDDVSALVAAGQDVQMVIGRADNIKITVADDLALAEFYLRQQQVV
jgi:2-C-methyl-D-erythritol 4-phosphate cytidylyltransferase